MVKLKLVNGKFMELESGSKDPESFYMDGLLKKNLDAVKKIIRNDWDYLFVVDGEVGSGKSVLTQQMAYYVTDGKFQIEQTCFTPKDFKAQILKAQRYGAVVFDEAFRGMSSRGSMTQTNKILVSLLQEIRQKNLFIFIVLPSIWDLDRYVALHRTKGLFHVYTNKQKQRGFFAFYDKSAITEVMANPMKYRYKTPNRNKFFGRFLKYYPLSEDDYRQKKESALDSYGAPEEKKVSLARHKTLEKVSCNVFNYLRSVHGFNQNKIAQITGLNRHTIADLEKEWNIVH